MHTRVTVEQRGGETIFSPRYRDTWINIILPLLENKSEYYNDDKKLRDIWQISHTCKSARIFALQYLAKRYKKDTLTFLEKHYNKDIMEISDRKRPWLSLFVDSRMTSCTSFILETLRVVTFLSLVIPEVIARDLRNKSIEPNVSPDKIVLVMMGILLALSLLIAANNYHDRLEHNNSVDKELAFPLKRRDQVIRQRLTLFPEPQKPSVVETIKQNCNIQ